MANFDPHQQAVAVPEAIWMPFIQDFYPNLMHQTYSFPPIHFHRAPQVVKNIAGQIALVRDNPPKVKRPRKQSPVPLTPPSLQTAGRAFSDIPSHTRRICVEDKHQRDDDAQQRCLDTLSTFNEVMMVISTLYFRKYLSIHTYTDPLHAEAIGKLPAIEHRNIPKNVADGECDIVIIHRSYGLLSGEIKSVGNNEYFRKQTPDEQMELIRQEMEEALKQLRNREIALRHLVSDLPAVRITKTVLLPNIASSQLREALSTFRPLLQRLCKTLSLPVDVDLAVGCCLCEEDLHQPRTWWQRLHAAGPDQFMAEFLYKRLVARFCGPCTTVEIPTSSPPRKVVRSLGQAVAETGLRFSLLTLTQTQVDLLYRWPEPRFLYLLGPPGTGKTIVLLLKALQWVWKHRRVMIVSGDVQSKAVTLLVETQLHSMVESSYATYVQRHFCDFSKDDFDARDAAKSLQLEINSYTGPVLVLMDEFDRSYRQEYTLCYSDRRIKWLGEVRAELPNICVWAAGIFKLDNDRRDPPPDWLEVQTLQEPLRCPPTVSAQLQQSADILKDNVPKYLDPQHPVATRGPEVSRGKHRDQPGHCRGDHPWQCETCANNVAAVIKKLHVGQPDHGLQYKDVWILYGGDDEPCDDDVIVIGLRQHHIPLRMVRSDCLDETAVKELALAISDEVIVTHCKAAQGLERQVIISLGTQGWSTENWDLHSQSRSSSFLHIID